jgi:hypothetical protein
MTRGGFPLQSAEAKNAAMSRTVTALRTSSRMSALRPSRAEVPRSGESGGFWRRSFAQDPSLQPGQPPAVLPPRLPAEAASLPSGLAP